MFYERLQALCLEKGLAVSAALNIMGMSSGNMTRWRKGQLPGGKALRTMSRFFDVPVDFLVGPKEDSLTVQQEKLLLMLSSVPVDKRTEFLTQAEQLAKSMQDERKAVK